MTKISAIILLVLGLCTVSVFTKDVDDLPNTVIRTNWGVIYHRIGAMLNGVSNFRHTFKLHIPKLEFTPLATLDCTLPGMEYVYCDESNILVDRINHLYVQEYSHTKSVLNDVLAALGSGNGGGRGGGRRKMIKRAIPEDNDACDTERIGSGDNGVFSWVGDVLRDVSQAPSFDSLGAIDSDICTLSKAANKDASRLLASNKRLASQSVIMTKKAKALGKGLEDTNRQVTRIQEEITKTGAEMADALNNVNNRLKIQTKAQASVIELMATLDEMEAHVVDELDYAEDFELGIHRLMEGFVPQILIDPEEIQKVLDHVSTNVIPKQLEKLQLSLVHSKPVFYYSVKSTVFTAKHDFLYINFVVPMRAEGGVLGVYRIDQAHISTNEHHQSSTRIENLPELFAITPDEQYYTELSTAQFATCRGDAILKVCDTERALISSNTHTCASSLFFDQVQETTRLCRSTLEQRARPTRIVALGPRTYFVHEHNYENKTWSMMCHRDNLHANERITIIPACNTCTIELPCFCSLAGDTFTVPYQVDGCVVEDLESFSYPYLDIKHSVNLNVLTALTDPIVISDIKGDTPLNARIKNLLKGINYTITDNEWAGVVEARQEYDIDFKKLTKAQSTHLRVYKTKADAYLGTVHDRKLYASAHLTKIESDYGNDILVKWIVQAKQGNSYPILFSSLCVTALGMGLFVWLEPTQIHKNLTVTKMYVSIINVIS